MINIGSLELPISSATKTFAILAKRGAGKTYTGGVMAEEFYANNIPFVVFDPIDVWWGLKLDKDGKSKGLPIVVFGLEHADIKLDKDMGRTIAQMIVKHNISCIISTFGMPKKHQRHLIAEFAEELLNINNTPRHVFIEEAHEYVPQRVSGDIGKTFNAVSNLVVMGRNRGIGVTLLNQRASTMNKDVLTQLDSLLAFRNVSPQDRKAMKEWVEYHSAEGDFDKFMQSLPTLPNGEGWIWSPEFMGIFKKIKIRERRTFHPDREKLGNFVMPSLDSTDVTTFITEFNKSARKDSLEAKAKGGKQSSHNTAPPLDVGSIPTLSITNQQLIALRNEYEDKLIEKELVIKSLSKIINQIKVAVSVSDNPDRVMQDDINVSNSSNLEMWASKLPPAGQKILRFLHQNKNRSFTRNQISIGTGYSMSELDNRSLPTLKKAGLIIKEGNAFKINPEI